jgi:heterodisulfide reductase subunit C
MIKIKTADKKILRSIEEKARTSLSKCYQCGKCTAGCPMDFIFDLNPNEVIELIRLGQIEKVLNSKTIWYCATCYTCSTRCPKEIDIANIMTVMLREAISKNIIKDRKVLIFYKSFFKSIKRHGRVYEVGLVGTYNLTSGAPLTNAAVGPKILLKNKIGYLPERIKDLAGFRRIFQRSKVKI